MKSGLPPTYLQLGTYTIEMINLWSSGFPYLPLIAHCSFELVFLYTFINISLWTSSCYLFCFNLSHFPSLPSSPTSPPRTLPPPAVVLSNYISSLLPPPPDRPTSKLRCSHPSSGIHLRHQPLYWHCPLNSRRLAMRHFARRHVWARRTKSTSPDDSGHHYLAKRPNLS